ncbi:uncharacterized protein LOC144446892 [Glandiceps talaboti]
MAQPRIMIWCNPRARSTVFELSMASVPSFKVFHEEYVLAALMGEERAPGPFSTFPILPGYSFREVKERLEADYTGYEAVILKDVVPMALPGGTFKFLPEGYQHTFIIRHPRVAHRSMYKVSTELHEKGLLTESAVDFTYRLCTFQPLYDFYNSLVNEKGQKPIVIESDDLAQNPRDVLQRYCKATGIPFYESMVNWKPNNIGFWNELHASDFFSFIYKNAIESSCYRPPTKTQTKPGNEDDDLPAVMKELIEKDTPMYNEIIKHKI